MAKVYDITGNNETGFRVYCVTDKVFVHNWEIKTLEEAKELVKKMQESE